MKYRLRTLFVLTTIAAIVSLCLVPTSRSPLPLVWVQLTYAPHRSEVTVNDRRNMLTAFYTTLQSRLIDERKIAVDRCADPKAELRRLIRIKPSSDELHFSNWTISAWPTPLVQDVDELEVILSIAIDVFQETQRLGTNINVMQMP